MVEETKGTHLTMEAPADGGINSEEAARYKAIVEAFDGFVYICSEDFCIEFMNEKLIERTGYDGTGKPCYAVLHDLPSPCPWCVNERVFEGETARWDVRSPKDNRWYHVVNTPIYRPDGSISKQSMIQDITDRKMAQQALEESEARYRAIFDAVPDPVFIHELETGKVVDVNQAMLDAFRAKREDVVDTTFDKMPVTGTDEATAAKANEWLQKAAEEGTQVFEWVSPRLDGTTFPSEVCLTKATIGEQVRLVAVVRDISKRKEAEVALQESNERWHFAMQGSGAGLWDWQIQDMDGYVSERWAEMLGYTREELPPTNELWQWWEKQVHPDDIDHVMTELQKHLAGETEYYQTEHRMRSKSNAWIWVLDRGKVIGRDDDGTPIRMVGTHTDITAQKELEEKLRHSEKMNAIGQLAGGVAHDFNNQLAGIMGNADLLMNKFGDDHPYRSYLEGIVISAHRAADLTAQLLAFARKGKLVIKSVDLHRIVGETIVLLKRSIDRRIRLELELEARNSFVAGDASQLQNAILNLALNARDALEGEGTIRIETANPDPQRVRLRVIDNGKGMPSAMRSRIFEPFFTTKQEGQGTGLGLAAVYGAVESHGGEIEVESEEGKGSTFTVLLPCEGAKLNIDELSDQGAATVSPVSILLIEDEDVIIEMAKRALATFGHSVIVARNAAEADKLATTESIDVIVLDLMLPDRDGEELFDQLHETLPAVPIVISSGYDSEGKVGRLLQKGASGFVPKPYRISKLAEEIEHALEQK